MLYTFDMDLEYLSDQKPVSDFDEALINERAVDEKLLHCCPFHYRQEAPFGAIKSA